MEKPIIFRFGNEAFRAWTLEVSVGCNGTWWDYEDVVAVHASEIGGAHLTAISDSPEAVDALIDALYRARVQVFGHRDTEVTDVQRLERENYDFQAEVQKLKQELETRGNMMVKLEDAVIKYESLAKEAEDDLELVKDLLNREIEKRETLETALENAKATLEEARALLENRDKKVQDLEVIGEIFAHSCDTYSRAIHTIAQLLEVPTPPSRME